MQSANNETVANGREAARMYPNNSLKEPVKEMKFNIFDLAKKTFAK